MTQKAMTKDELFVLKLYEMAVRLSNPHEPIGCLEVAQAIGQNTKGAQVIARDLAQANFIKKTKEGLVSLTDHGIKLVYQIKQQQQS